MILTNRSLSVDIKNDLGESVRTNYQKYVEFRGLRFHNDNGEAIRILTDFIQVRDWKTGIAICGRSGSGKTSLLKAVCGVLIETNNFINFQMRVEESVDSGIIYLSSCDLTCPIMTDKTFKAIRSLPIMLLDDVGYERGEQGNSKIRDLLLWRHQEMLPTIIASEFDTVSLGEIYGLRLGEVLLEGYVCIELTRNFRREIITNREDFTL